MGVASGLSTGKVTPAPIPHRKTGWLRLHKVFTRYHAEDVSGSSRDRWELIMWWFEQIQ